MLRLFPASKVKSKIQLNLMPMIDFLFLMLAFFATLAIAKSNLFDTNVDLVQLTKKNDTSLFSLNEEKQHINLSITSNGTYKWITEIQEYPMATVENIKNELMHQYEIGILPRDKKNTEILLYIDKNAAWEPIAKLLFIIKEAGFEAHPIYENDAKN